MTKTFDSNKVYAAKSSVTRALKAAGVSLDSMNIITTEDGKFQAIPKLTPKVEGSKKPRNGNCHKVWDIADSMKGQRRKDVVAACVAAGINLGTAKTQYQQWYATQK